MGTDIHAVFQAKRNGEWVDIPTNWEEPRDYSLFSILAGVRNGRGFAGTLTGQPIIPISDPRGLPSDFEVIDDEIHDHMHPVTSEVMAASHRSKWQEPDEPDQLWMGYHDHSWLTVDEILSYTRPRAWETGIVSIDLFTQWDGASTPKEYSGGVSGRYTFVAENPCVVTSKTTHVRCFWLSDTNRHNEFFGMIELLKAEHGEVRMVFGFDS